MKDAVVFFFFTILCVISCRGQQPPEVTISLPVDNTTVSGITTVFVVAEDNEAGDSVALFIDDSIVCGYDERPFLYSWNTHVLDDNTEHSLYAHAYDRDGNEGVSDTVYVIISNGPLLFADGFESYIPGYTPALIWREIWPGVLDSTYVSQSYPHQGVKSYHSFGYAAYVRTDGVGFDTANVSCLSYEVSIMVPNNSENGALVGLFHRIDPQTGEIYDGVMFDPADHLVHVRGISPVATAFPWSRAAWYDVRVALDFSQGLMNVWIGTALVAENVETAYSTLSDTFALSTIYGCDGGIFYDDVRIAREEQ
ncbi:hypothetical protein JXB22_07695 [candidate division WOR-3 bacterium]|nr:hypothetical protein [candidate division WOR-3 bacterium]